MRAVYCLTRGKKTHILTNLLLAVTPSTSLPKTHTWGCFPRVSRAEHIL
jgi:hypothetical protein